MFFLVCDDAFMPFLAGNVADLWLLDKPHESEGSEVRERLGASDNLMETVWQKPKGMHWKTFEHLRQRELAAKNMATMAWVSQAQALCVGKKKVAAILRIGQAAGSL